jgi:2-(1,2-epoxy-1,2-dihydrophenyl)acetyl-CoA isomerase
MTDVVIETIGRTRVVAINRPEARNALTRSVIAGITDAFHTAARSNDVRCVVLTGTGGSFCAGADLRKNLMEDPDLMDKIEGYLDEYHTLVRSIVHCPKPTIAMIDGAAVGFGADLTLACDLRVVSETAYIQEKFVKIGLMPDGGGTFWLPRLVGTAKALRMIMLAEKIEANEMRELDLVVDVVPSAKLRERTLEIAKALADGPPLALAAIKRAIYGNLGSIDDALAREREGQLKLLRSNDAMEGILAWAQKREPNFEGK